MDEKRHRERLEKLDENLRSGGGRGESPPNENVHVDRELPKWVNLVLSVLQT